MGQGTLSHPQPAQRAGQNYLGSLANLQFPVSWIGVGLGHLHLSNLAQLCHSHPLLVAPTRLYQSPPPGGKVVGENKLKLRGPSFNLLLGL